MILPEPPILEFDAEVLVWPEVGGGMLVEPVGGKLHHLLWGWGGPGLGTEAGL